MSTKKPILVTKDPFYSKCPSCGKTEVLRKSKTRNFWEYSLKKILLINFYRCRECGWRGKRFSKRIKLTFKQIISYLFFAAIFAWVSWKILNDYFN